MLQITPRSDVEFPETPSWQPFTVAVIFAKNVLQKDRVLIHFYLPPLLSLTSAEGIPAASVSEECAAVELNSAVHQLLRV